MSTITNTNENYNLQSLSNALDVIDLLCMEPNLGTSEITKKLKLGRSAVFRVLATLESKGYVIKDSNSKYRLSYKFVSIGQNIKQSDTLIPQIHPYLEHITAISGETCHLVVWDSVTKIMFIDKVLSSSSIHMASMVGLTRTAHLTGTGKILLAYADAEHLSQYMEHVEFVQMTDKSIMTKMGLVEELGRIRQNGYATDDEECEEGLFCIAAPVFQLGKAVAAISISGPVQRMKDNQEGNTQLLKEMTSSISQKLG